MKKYCHSLEYFAPNADRRCIGAIACLHTLTRWSTVGSMLRPPFPPCAFMGKECNRCSPRSRGRSRPGCNLHKNNNRFKADASM